jgi:hypothetical protein
MGLAINLELTVNTTANAAMPATRKKRKYTKRKKTTDAVSTTATKTATTAKSASSTRKMTAAGSARVKQASAAYHADIRSLREDGLTLKQARAQYKQSKPAVT